MKIPSSALTAFAIRHQSSVYTRSSCRLLATLSNRLDGLDKPTVWHEFSPLAVKYGAINLGQGFPDWEPPEFAVEAFKKALSGGNNQYARSAAHMKLAKVLSDKYSKRLGIDHINPETMVATACGCTNVMYCALHGLLNEGDEVVMLEPAFDIYHAQVGMAGGTPKFVPLRPKEGATNANDYYQLDMVELEAAIGPKTKVIILNSPHNPTGKIFSREEMSQIAEICRKFDHLTVISDEVYEHIIFEGEHLSFASLPGMWEKTLTLSSSGKTFSNTGWKVGWAVGPPNLIKAVSAVQQWVNFSIATPNQEAIADCLVLAEQPYKIGGEKYDTYYQYLASSYKDKRDLLIAALKSAGITPIVPNGGFFIIGDTTNINFPNSYLDELTEASPNPMPRDWALSRFLTKEVGVTAIPPSAFYSPETRHLASNTLRFAYCKGNDTIIEAHKRLKAYDFGGVDKENM